MGIIKAEIVKQLAAPVVRALETVLKRHGVEWKGVDITLTEELEAKLKKERGWKIILGEFSKAGQASPAAPAPSRASPTKVKAASPSST